MLAHRMTGTKTYRAWKHMKERCNNPNIERYKDYGGRGISYDPAWERFESFLADMGIAPEETSLDRIDVDAGYFKSNCRWATAMQQALNHRKQRNNTSGLAGVSFSKALGVWQAYFSDCSVMQFLYQGKDFFEACCARKSWEANFRGVF